MCDSHKDDAMATLGMIAFGSIFVLSLVVGMLIIFSRGG